MIQESFAAQFYEEFLASVKPNRFVLHIEELRRPVEAGRAARLYRAIFIRQPLTLEPAQRVAEQYPGSPNICIQG